MTLTSATSTTQAVVGHHLERFAALDLQGVLADYAPDAVVIVPTCVLRGVHEITPSFKACLPRSAEPAPRSSEAAGDEVSDIWWAARPRQHPPAGPDHRRSGKACTLGVGDLCNFKAMYRVTEETGAMAQWKPLCGCGC